MIFTKFRLFRRKIKTYEALVRIDLTTQGLLSKEKAVKHNRCFYVQKEKCRQNEGDGYMYALTHREDLTRSVL